MSETFESHFAKYKKLIPALALLIHLVDYGLTPINIRSFNKALKWEVYLKSHASRIYSMRQTANNLVSVSVGNLLIEGKLKDGFTARDIYRGRGNVLGNADEVKGSLSLLCEKGWLREDTVITGGKNKTVYRIDSSYERVVL